MERKIIIGLIVSTEFLQQIKDEWNPEYIESQVAKTLAGWCWEFYNTHNKAPNKEIESILIKKLRKKKIKKDLAEELETDILQGLSEQYTSNDLDVDALLTDTREYFTERQLQLLSEELQTYIEKGEIDKAKAAYEKFQLIEGGQKEGLDLSSDEVFAKIDEAFDTNNQIVIKFTGALGDFWNDELVRGGFVAILAPEKRGKTFMLMEAMMEGYLQKRKVAFFQAGDMTEGQQLIRTAIYLAQKSNKEKFCGKQYIPVLDCIKNQTDTCNKKIRACQFGVFEPDRVENLRQTITYDELVEAHQANKFYKNCYNCLNWSKNKWGTPWLARFDNGKDPLTAKEAKNHFKKFFHGNETIKLSTHANGELTINKMKSILSTWARKDKFVPDLILVDYADLLVSTERMDTRHQIDHIWRSLRGMSQTYNALIIAPTQADAKSYEQELLKLGNFSEDKRKLAHVTAMYGLNQSPDGREKKLGIMRINKIVVREDGFHESDQVHILQKLAIGRPNLGSYI
jgi:hypothetical protein